MSATAQFEHPYPETLGLPFFDDADVIYGADGGLILGAAIINGVTRAKDLLAFANFSTTSLRLDIVRPPRGHDRNHAAHMWANTGDDAVSIMCNPAAGVSAVARDLERGLPHEFGHLAHYQINPGFETEIPARGLFTLAIREGVARAVELEAIDPRADEEQRWIYRHDKTLSSELGRLLRAAGKCRGGRAMNFLYGRHKKVPRPYYVGHYVVSSFALYNGLDIQTLMKTSVSEYVAFAEAELVETDDR